MRYHINKKGEVSICLAVFKNCPYSQHFNSFSAGQEYMDDWEGNKETYPKLRDEDILKPENEEFENFLLKDNTFSKRKLFKAFDSVGLNLETTNNLDKNKLFNRFKEKDYSISNILSSFDYSASDVILDKNTKLRVFNLTPDPEYNYNSSGQIYPTVGGSYV